MNNEKDLQSQIDELKRRLDAFNASQTIPLAVDLSWKNRGFIKTDFFVAGKGTLSSSGTYFLPIPGSTKDSIALVTPHVGSPGAIEAELIEGYASNVYGDSTSQFDITNPAGTTFRYTWDGNGTNPNISATTIPVGSRLVVASANFNSANTSTSTRPFFIVTGSGANYFEVDNDTPGVVESNKTLGVGGSIIGGPHVTTYELYVSGTASTEFSFVVFLFTSLYADN